MFLVPFRSPTSSRGPLPIFRNYFFGHSGSPGSLSNSGPLPPHLPQTRASRPGYPARPIRSASGPPWLSLPAPSSRSGPGLGQEFAWWARARSEVGVFCARAPPRPARRGGGGRGAEAAPGRPRAGRAQASSGSPSRAGSAGSSRREKLVLLLSPPTRAPPRPSPLPAPGSHALGLERRNRPSSWGGVVHFTRPPSQRSLSLLLREVGESLAGCGFREGTNKM